MWATHHAPCQKSIVYQYIGGGVVNANHGAQKKKMGKMWRGKPSSPYFSPPYGFVSTGDPLNVTSALVETSLDSVIVIGHLNNRAEVIKSSLITCLADSFNCTRLIRDATIQMIVCRKLNLLIHADLD